MNLLKVVIFFSCLIPFNSFTQTYDAAIDNIVNQSSYDTILNNLQQFEALGVKEHGTTELGDALDWLINKYNQFGYTDITQDTFDYFGSTSVNLIVEKKGCIYPDTYVIIDGHYDTKNGPGTNDNGSGTAILLEIARLLKDVETEYSILFIHFAGEEDGLRGSQHYVNNTVIPQNMDIKVVFNIDEVGGVNGMTNNTIVCERDESGPPGNNAASATITDELATCVELYSSLQTEIDYAYSSDYIPFQNNGEIITGLFEKNQTPHAHTSTDVLSNMDVPYVHEIAKGSIGASLHYAVMVQPYNVSILTCGDYTSPSGNYTWTSSGLYQDTVTGVHGCDSILHVDLTIQNIDNAATRTGNILSAAMNGASYRWLDCDNGHTGIPGETGQSFTVTTNGNYAVEISLGDCTDTSDCILVDNLGLDPLFLNDQVSLHPNPSTGLIHIESPFEVSEIEITNVQGQQMYKSTTNLTELDLSNWSEGVYYLKIHLGEVQIIRKAVIQRQ